MNNRLFLAATAAILGLALLSRVDAHEYPHAAKKAGASMSDSIQIIQGRTATHGTTRLGLVNVFDRHDVRLDAWSEDKRWLGKLKLKRSDVFPVAGGFLRVQDVANDGQRDNVSLVAFSAPGIDAPATKSLVLVEGGELVIGEQALRIVALDRDSVSIETWPKLHPRDVVEPAKVDRHEIIRDGELSLDTGSLRVVRLQPRAGEMLGFVELAQP